MFTERFFREPKMVLVWHYCKKNYCLKSEPFKMFLAYWILFINYGFYIIKLKAKQKLMHVIM